MTTLFILIAYFIRKRFISEDASFLEKVLYYTSSVVMTPIFGPWVFKKITENLSVKEKSKYYGYSIFEF